MKKRTSSMFRRIVSLLMSLVLTLTLVTPAAFATEVVGGSGTAIIEGNANPADANPSGDNEGKDDENKDTEHGGDEQPTNPGDEDKNPGEGEGDDANKPDEDKKDEAPDGENKDEENKDEQPTEDENNGEDDISLLNDDTDSDVWDGKPAEKFADGAGTVDDPYKISTGAELAYLAEKVNGGESYSGNYFKLTSDIRLNTDDVPTSGNEWTPIGNGTAKPFSGIFDGAGHVISGLYISDAAFPGLFGNVSGTVQNLVVQGSVTAGNKAVASTGGYAAGGIACEAGNVIQNCGFYGKVSDSTGWYLDIGGVVGIGGTNNCWYYQMPHATNDKKLGTAGSYATNSYQNVSNGVNGTYINDDFAAAVAEKLNPAAFEKGWKLWAAEAGENAKPYPVFSEQNTNDMVFVKLQPYVKYGMNSGLFGKVTFDGGGTSVLVKVGTKLTLKANGVTDAFYTTESGKSYTTTNDLKKFSEGYTVDASDGGKVVTLYYGSGESVLLRCAQLHHQEHYL